MKKIFLILSLLASTFLFADELFDAVKNKNQNMVVEITSGMPYVEFERNGKKWRIERNSVEDSYLKNTFALTSRPSPPFFIEPFSVDDGVETYGELEVLQFLKEGRGIFIDARLENWFAKSAIPGAENIPFKLFLDETPEREKVLKRFGAQYNKEGQWSFSNVEEVLLYCNGAWCGQSPTAINALIELGYPKSKIKYYRGGMQAWQLLGLTTYKPGEVK